MVFRMGRRCASAGLLFFGVCLAAPAAAKAPDCDIHIESATFDRAVHVAGEPVTARLEATARGRRGEVLDADGRQDCLYLFGHYPVLLAVEQETGQRVAFTVDQNDAGEIVLSGRLSSAHSGGTYTIAAGPGVAFWPTMRQVAQQVFLAAPLEFEVAPNPEADRDPPVLHGLRVKLHGRYRHAFRIEMDLRDVDYRGMTLVLARVDDEETMEVEMRCERDVPCRSIFYDRGWMHGAWRIDAFSARDGVGNATPLAAHPLFDGVVIDFDHLAPGRSAILRGSFADRAALSPWRTDGSTPDVRVLRPIRIQPAPSSTAVRAPI